MRSKIRAIRSATALGVVGVAVWAIWAHACLVDSVCYNDADCPTGQRCSLQKGATSGLCRDQCKNDKGCPEGLVCSVECAAQEDCSKSQGYCKEPACDSDKECPAHRVCSKGRCKFGSSKVTCPSDMVAINKEFCIDIYEASRPDATVKNAGKENARAVSRPNVLPWQVQNKSEARAACEAAGKMLCTEREWFITCRGPKGRVYSYGDTYKPTVCNGIDKYCKCPEESKCADAKTCPFTGCFMSCADDDKRRTAYTPAHVDATGINPDCTNGYGVYDINGNVWEYLEDTSENQVRGGAYDCRDSQLLHRCDYVPSTKRASRGFRCCSGGGASSRSVKEPADGATGDGI